MTVRTVADGILEYIGALLVVSCSCLACPWKRCSKAAFRIVRADTGDLACSFGVMWDGVEGGHSVSKVMPAMTSHKVTAPMPTSAPTSCAFLSSMPNILSTFVNRKAAAVPNTNHKMMRCRSRIVVWASSTERATAYRLATSLMASARC